MDEKIRIIDEYFDAANYLSVGQLYLKDNPLLKRKLSKEDIKKKIVGHFGTVPAQNFIYAHLNRIIKENNLNMIYVSGPGHGGNSPVANTYLEGTYSEYYKDITEDENGMKKLFKRFSFPGGIPSHAAPETPGSIHEGGELGYSLAHSFGFVLDNPDLIVACVIGDGEAETGPLATSWHGIKFLNNKKDGFVLPILNLNGYKISNPTVLSRMSRKELGSYFYGLGYHPYLVEDDDRNTLHKKMYLTLDKVLEDFKNIKEGKNVPYPMIVLRTPKGWTGPKIVKGHQIEGTFRAHQVPLQINDEEDIELLEKWLKSYHPEKVFSESGQLKKEIKDSLPKGKFRMGSSLYANGGKLYKELNLPDIYEYACNFDVPGSYETEDMICLSKYLRDVYKNNNFRLFSPDEAMSNRLYRVFDKETRVWQREIKDTDEYLSHEGRIMDSYLSEHMCEGMLEGYLLTGRHGIFVSYEAFVRVIDSMVIQHAKWLKMCEEVPFREAIASLNIILTSHIWQQDHNGYTHQEPGFLNVVADKKDSMSRIYLPYDANSLIVTVDHVLKTQNRINAIVASKHPSVQWLSMKQAVSHFNKGIGIWDFASNDNGKPDIIIASAGDTPTLEAIAAIKILNKELPKLKIRYINVIDLMTLKKTHPHGISDDEYTKLFTIDKPILFNFHGFPSLIYSLTYDRVGKMKVKGYIEEGTITTPFDMRVRNGIDRYSLVIDAIKMLKLGTTGETIIKKMEDNLKRHKEYINDFGLDLEEIRNFNYR